MNNILLLFINAKEQTESASELKIITNKNTYIITTDGEIGVNEKVIKIIV